MHAPSRTRVFRTRVFALALLSAAATASAQNPLTTAVMKNYTEMKQNLVEAAALMPDDAYGYKLTPPQFSFGEWMSHSASANFYYCARFGGTARPDAAMLRSMRGKTAKADLRKFLEDSFAFCDAALQGMDDKKAVTEVQFNIDTLHPATFLVGLLTSLNEHYGNVVGYLRTKGITPPSTAREESKSQNKK